MTHVERGAIDPHLPAAGAVEMSDQPGVQPLALECPPDEIARDDRGCAGTRFPAQATAVAQPSVPAAQRRSERTTSRPRCAAYEARRLES
jgi:hypothetical protein